MIFSNSLLRKAGNGWLALALLCATSASAEPNSSSGFFGQKVMNPDLSLDGLFSASQFSTAKPITHEGGHDPHGNGFEIQQVELTLGAAVDPYFRADSNIVLTAKGIEIEEAYATSLDLPANLQVKAGQFFTAFGRNNPVHPHAWNFVNKPLVLGRMFGGDGLRNPGAQLSWLTVLPWYSELIGSAQTSFGEQVPSFLGTTGSMRGLGDSLLLLRSNNFVSLSDEFGLNFGASYANGANLTGGKNRTQVAGLDLYLKYRRPSSMSFITLQVEALKRFYGTGAGSLEDAGFYAELGYRLGGGMQRWLVGLRYDLVGDKAAPVATSGTPDNDLTRRWRLTPAITYYMSEFSKLRLQYDYDSAVGRPVQHMVALQLEFIIGAHGAHKF